MTDGDGSSAGAAGGGPGQPGAQTGKGQSGRGDGSGASQFQNVMPSGFAAPGNMGGLFYALQMAGQDPSLESLAAAMIPYSGEMSGLGADTTLLNPTHRRMRQALQATSPRDRLQIEQANQAEIGTKMLEDQRKMSLREMARRPSSRMGGVSPGMTGGEQMVSTPNGPMSKLEYLLMQERDREDRLREIEIRKDNEDRNFNRDIALREIALKELLGRGQESSRKSSEGRKRRTENLVMRLLGGLS